MSDWKKELQSEINAKCGGHQNVAADKMGVSPQTLSGWLKGRRAPKPHLRKFYLEKLSDKAAPKEEVAFYEQKDEDSQDVPIISWAQAGEAHEFSGIPFSWQETTRVAIPPKYKALGIQIQGDSMEPRYYHGQLAIVLPEMRPYNGGHVIAHIKKIGVVFKRFHCNGDPNNPIIRLTSYNPQFAPMEYPEKDFFWIWPVAKVVDDLMKL